MFAQIAPRYDLLNSLMSLSLHHRWRAYAVSKLNLKRGDSALDVCSGTGDFMLPLRRAVGSQGHVFGLDFCLPMLQVAKQKELKNLALADACKLPVRDAALNGVSVGWGIRNVPDIDAAHKEICRALKPGGRFVSLDMAQPRNSFLKALSRFMFKTVAPKLGALFGNKEAYTYLPESTERFWSREELASSMQKAGFKDVGCKDLMMGNICVHWGTKP
jgi:demethylmenaquinone methyltransferase/2-methoxy-6-polyprenyl-1,4-benzoquinol methylase